MSQETPPKDPREADLLEPEPAWEAAHAEKPFRDSLVDYRDSLSEEGKMALEYIASEEGKKAIAKYQETREESPAMRVLRDRALATLELPQNVREIYAGKAWKGSLDKDWAARCKYGLEELGKEFIERVLNDEHMNATQKLNDLKYLGPDIGDGINSFINGKSLREVGGGAENMLWGYLLASLMDVNSETKINLALESISKKTQTPEGTLLRRHFNFFERARKSYPEIGKKLDLLMDNFGWLWDKKQNKYISINE